MITIADSLTPCIFDDYSPLHQGYPCKIVGGKRVYLHREVLEQKLGRPIDPNLKALHKCTNRTCINPDHLFEGSTTEMVAQTVAAKRHSYGSNRPQAKLTEDTAYEALKELNKGHTGSLIANNIGVDPSQISRLKTGKAWNHVREKYEKDKQRGDYE